MPPAEKFARPNVSVVTSLALGPAPGGSGVGGHVPMDGASAGRHTLTAR
ncbi:hypothetical protein BJ999_005482 [Actinomadura citrea]|jgi:hypothetical protein|uniref:Uncharacterized protein n=1 Tax=Actinomadura citrea TaxID=46158 RepID=A0A7Y9KF83_9ACTN|nr:hypothetical protein [Actinomadura citrea]